jgi:hypothetical protein
MEQVVLVLLTAPGLVASLSGTIKVCMGEGGEKVEPNTRC